MGLFDLVGTHPDFEGNGLGKAVMAEGRRRMQAASMRRAVLGFDPNNVAAVALYTSPTECTPSFLCATKDSAGASAKRYGKRYEANPYRPVLLAIRLGARNSRTITPQRARWYNL